MAKSEDITLPNGKKATEVYKEVKQEVENIYLEGWSKGVSIPFWDKEGNFYLANPDGSEASPSPSGTRKATFIWRIRTGARIWCRSTWIKCNIQSFHE